ncbi:ICMT-domain-containing protein, partial [Testicularia cyperi]
ASPSSSSLFAWLLSQYTTQWVIPPAYAPAALQICITAFPLGVLFGLVLPRVFAFLVDGSLYTAVARLLMQTQAAQQQQLEGSWWCFPQLSIYLLAWSLFHLLEFTVTAAYNPTRLYSDSFLLNNGIHYHVAHVVALIEFAVTASVVPSTKRPGILTLVGLLLVVFGQVFRSGAMIHASKNFSHIVADKKRQDHELVTTGVYAWVRHPSYVGFFYWALGTQLLLGNVVATLGFVVTLYKFFSNRIRAEERYLVEFFGDQYRLYRKTTGSGLPFIK